MTTADVNSLLDEDEDLDKFKRLLGGAEEEVRELGELLELSEREYEDAKKELDAR